MEERGICWVEKVGLTLRVGHQIPQSVETHSRYILFDEYCGQRLHQQQLELDYLRVPAAKHARGRRNLVNLTFQLKVINVFNKISKKSLIL